MSERHAVVLVSGGLDSATTLAIACQAGFICHALSFDYGQKHRAELSAAAQLAKQLGAREHRTLRIDLGALGGSALTDAALAVPETPQSGIPITYVPARNTVFLAFALGWAEILRAADIFIGVNAIDYSGYPDCRPEFIDAFATTANLATKASVEGTLHFKIHAPLIQMTKVEIVRRGAELGVDFGATVSCYQADEQGRACGRCDACRLRGEAFAKAAMDDPTRYQPSRR
jgi:7-cyano-7-deazaguanine synthase